jgi:hypothetical protein
LNWSSQVYEQKELAFSRIDAHAMRKNLRCEFEICQANRQHDPYYHAHPSLLLGGADFFPYHFPTGSPVFEVIMPLLFVGMTVFVLCVPRCRHLPSAIKVAIIAG